ncbi:hypothetical protein [Arcticibacterium luteifluviistationis]|uniref:Zinc-finger domain-containing protein n=1 Tax=Arcticibacterium luteifluviistationis TaxID=1784714 RepID=A0A2Z4GB16_9BACT|nr:hypothetical protein [Arcticibacterium luteifluviistationis]AWV98472.1 hypothetical protein DJ013_09930 [Arcticibacterium luteifluviistationis]
MKILKRIMSYMLLSCQKATQLIEKRKIHNLSWQEKILLDSHLGMCKACKGYEKQSETIDQLFEHHHQSTDDSAELSDKEKDELIKFLQNNN